MPPSKTNAFERSKSSLFLILFALLFHSIICRISILNLPWTPKPDQIMKLTIRQNDKDQEIDRRREKERIIVINLDDNTLLRPLICVRGMQWLQRCLFKYLPYALSRHCWAFQIHFSPNLLRSPFPIFKGYNALTCLLRLFQYTGIRTKVFLHPIRKYGTSGLEQKCRTSGAHLYSTLSNESGVSIEKQIKMTCDFG